MHLSAAKQASINHLAEQNSQGMCSKHLAQLKARLADADIDTRLSIYTNLEQLTSHMDKKTICTDLIPLISQSVTNEEDEVLVVIAECILSLENRIGAENLELLLNLLIDLSEKEEHAVRMKTIETMQKLTEKHNSNIIFQSIIVNEIDKLPLKTWFTQKESTIHFGQIIYPYLDHKKRKLVHERFSFLSKDTNPIIKRTVTKALSEMCFFSSEDECLSVYLPILQQLETEEQDTTRLLTVELAIGIADKLAYVHSAEAMLSNYFKNRHIDTSWRVRYILAKKYDLFIQTQMKKSKDTSALLESFSLLVRDTEPEVRIAVASRLKHVSLFFDREEIQKCIVPAIRKLAVDGTHLVRSEVALAIGSAAFLLGSTLAIKELKSVFMQLLEDESSDVRLNAIESLGELKGVFGLNIIEREFLNALHKLNMDKEWRVRKSTIEIFAAVLGEMSIEYFKEKFQNICFEWLIDPVHNVRCAAIEFLEKLCLMFGEEWIVSSLLPELKRLSTATLHIHRQTAVATYSMLLKTRAFSETSGTVLPLLYEHSYDRISIVRVAVAETLGLFAKQHLDKLKSNERIAKDIENILRAFSTDSDPDVREYSEDSFVYLNT